MKYNFDSIKILLKKGTIMYLSKLLLILLAVNTFCFASETGEKTQTKPSIWSYLKYIDPYYYWKKYQLKRVTLQINEVEQKLINDFNDNIELYKSDINMLQKITNETELNQNKETFKTSVVLLQLEKLGSTESFLKAKENIIQELENGLNWLESAKQKILLLDQEIEKAQELKQQLKND